MDIPSKIARSSVRKAIGKSVVGQPLSAVVKKALRLALNMDAHAEQVDSVKQVGDIRNIAGDGLYDCLKSSGRIAKTADEF